MFSKKTIIKIVACICAIVSVVACFTACSEIDTKEVNVSDTEITVKVGEYKYVAWAYSIDDGKTGTVDFTYADDDNEKDPSWHGMNVGSIYKFEEPESDDVALGGEIDEPESSHLALGDNLYFSPSQRFNDAEKDDWFKDYDPATITVNDLGESVVSFAKENADATNIDVMVIEGVKVGKTTVTLKGTDIEKTITINVVE